MDDPPLLDPGELTDKGSVNQRAVLSSPAPPWSSFMPNDRPAELSCEREQAIPPKIGTASVMAIVRAASTVACSAPS